MKGQSPWSALTPTIRTAEIAWTEEALKRMERAPVFLRGMVKRLAEKKARELGYGEITEDILDQFKNQMMGRMGGESGMAAAAEQMAQGHLPWTAAAKARLETVPEFMRHMIKQIAEEMAVSAGISKSTSSSSRKWRRWAIFKSRRARRWTGRRGRCTSFKTNPQRPADRHGLRHGHAEARYRRPGARERRDCGSMKQALRSSLGRATGTRRLERRGLEAATDVPGFRSKRHP